MDFKTLLENYNMGLISPLEFVSRYRDMLFLVGADTELQRILNKVVTPLANHLAAIIADNGNNCIKISDYWKNEKAIRQ